MYNIECGLKKEKERERELFIFFICPAQKMKYEQYFILRRFFAMNPVKPIKFFFNSVEPGRKIMNHF